MDLSWIRLQESLRKYKFCVLAEFLLRFPISEAITVVIAILYLGIAEKKENIETIRRSQGMARNFHKFFTKLLALTS